MRMQHVWKHNSQSGTQGTSETTILTQCMDSIFFFQWELSIFIKGMCLGLLQNVVRIAKIHRWLFPKNKIFLFVACNIGQLLVKKDKEENEIWNYPAFSS